MLLKRILFGLFVVVLSSPIFADDAGSRGAYTRGGWAGARYVASGMSGVVMSDDIFSMYWNPAGLSDLLSKKKMTEDDVARKAKEKKYGEITEADLLNFSENSSKRNFLDFGASYTGLDVERDALFTGVAFGLFNGVFGAGLYSVISRDIETRDSDGNLTGKNNYAGAEGFISYAWSSAIYSVGLSIKPLYEKIGDSTYSGLGSDIGVQVFVLPFIKVGVMARDVCSFLKPSGSTESESEYDFFKPEISSGISLITDSGIVLSLTTSKRIEQDGFYVGGGVEYHVKSYFSISAGMFDESFTAGFELSLLNMRFGYALSLDRVDGGYNNTLSMELIF